MRVLFFVLLFIGSLPAMGVSRGTNSGGGGLVVACRNGTQIESVELLDLWETKKHLNPYLDLEPLYSSSPVVEQVRRGIQKLKHAFQLSMIETHGRTSDVYLSGLLQSVSDAFVYRNNIRPGFFAPVINPLRGVELKLTPDIYEIATPAAPCKIEQAVTFDDAGEIAYLNMDLIDFLNETDQAALILHEAFYKVLRSYSIETSSIRVRRAIGYIMSGNNLSPIESHVPKERIECTSSSRRTKIYIYRVEEQAPVGPTLFGMTTETVAGVRMLGYSIPNQFIASSSIDDFFTTWLSPEGTRPFALHERPWHSPVDYDMSVSLEVTTTGDRRQVFVRLNSSPGQIHNDLREEVFCKTHK